MKRKLKQRRNISHISFGRAKVMKQKPNFVGCPTELGLMRVIDWIMRFKLS